MALDPKTAGGGSAPHREKGVKIFTYPKIFFIFPTLIMSFICWIGMSLISQEDVAKFNESRAEGKIAAKAAKIDKANEAREAKTDKRPPLVADENLPLRPNPIAFKRPENIFGLLFLLVLFLNMMILAIDFPRFAIFGIVLGGTTVTFVLLYVSVYVDVLRPVFGILQGVYVVANPSFYLLVTLILLATYGVIFITRYLDYWEIMPNEILHHHGPLSDLERYPTMNLKFDKEIPDVFEHMMFGAGKLVLHVSDERKAIVLETVLGVSKKEETLKKLMSRLEVRVTTDQEVASP